MYHASEKDWESAQKVVDESTERRRLVDTARAEELEKQGKRLCEGEISSEWHDEVLGREVLVDRRCYRLGFDHGKERLCLGHASDEERKEYWDRYCERHPPKSPEEPRFFAEGLTEEQRDLLDELVQESGHYGWHPGWADKCVEHFTRGILQISPRDKEQWIQVRGAFRRAIWTRWPKENTRLMPGFRRRARLKDWMAYERFKTQRAQRACTALMLYNLGVIS